VVELAIPGDAPTLVFHGAVGDIELGMSRSAVERRYGGGDVETLRGYSLAGTRYARRVLTRVRYQLHGGVVAVDYVGADVKVVHTTSGFYKTRRGVGVGTRIPLGR